MGCHVRISRRETAGQSHCLDLRLDRCCHACCEVVGGLDGVASPDGPRRRIEAYKSCSFEKWRAERAARAARHCAEYARDKVTNNNASPPADELKLELGGASGVGVRHMRTGWVWMEAAAPRRRSSTTA